MTNTTVKPKIGLALGSGASRGWSHIGVIKRLLREGISPDIVCGTSVGAMVGGSFVAGNMDKLEEWVLSASKRDVLKFLQINFSQAGIVDVERFNWFLHNFVAAEDIQIEDLAKKYAAVTTDIDSGREVWLKEGGLAETVRASMAMPGLFPAVYHDQRWLADGGLVNPVPVSACRALGADIVIAVNLNSDIIGKRNNVKRESTSTDTDGVLESLKQQARQYSSSVFANNTDKPKTPGLFYSVTNAINIFQYRITRSRLAGDPAEILISPRLGDIGILDFHRAADAIQEGEQRIEAALPEIFRITQGGGPQLG